MILLAYAETISNVEYSNINEHDYSKGLIVINYSQLQSTTMTLADLRPNNNIVTCMKLDTRTCDEL